MNYQIIFEWEPIGSVRIDAHGELEFPLGVPDKPGIYQLATNGEVYVGQSTSLRTRFSQYRTPGGSAATLKPNTNRHVNRWLIKKISADEPENVRAEICTKAEIAYEDKTRKQLDLKQVFNRMLVENLALHLGLRNGLALVNKQANEKYSAQNHLMI